MARTINSAQSAKSVEHWSVKTVAAVFVSSGVQSVKALAKLPLTAFSAQGALGEAMAEDDEEEDTTMLDEEEDGIGEDEGTTEEEEGTTEEDEEMDDEDETDDEETDDDADETDDDADETDDDADDEDADLLGRHLDATAPSTASRPTAKICKRPFMFFFLLFFVKRDLCLKREEEKYKENELRK